MQFWIRFVYMKFFATHWITCSWINLNFGIVTREKEKLLLSRWYRQKNELTSHHIKRKLDSNLQLIATIKIWQILPKWSISWISYSRSCTSMFTFTMYFIDWLDSVRQRYGIDGKGKSQNRQRKRKQQQKYKINKTDNRLTCFCH